jgi:hypothetical protein
MTYLKIAVFPLPRTEKQQSINRLIFAATILNLGASSFWYALRFGLCVVNFRAFFIT